ncbi:hypothetical protein [Marinoscillum sp.]|uniref:hypothetical protein n=1 Tax=Marinoscillum sp. TaxID=2024838 RepID=UPI003BADBCA8
MKQPDKPYLKRSFTPPELIVGAVISALVILFFLVYKDIQGWEWTPLGYAWRIAAMIPYGFGVVVGARFYFMLIEKMDGNMLRIPLLIFYVPLVAYSGWLLFLVKGYAVVTREE